MLIIRNAPVRLCRFACPWSPRQLSVCFSFQVDVHQPPPLPRNLTHSYKLLSPPPRPWLLPARLRSGQHPLTRDQFFLIPSPAKVQVNHPQSPGTASREEQKAWSLSLMTPTHPMAASPTGLSIISRQNPVNSHRHSQKQKCSRTGHSRVIPVPVQGDILHPARQSVLLTGTCSGYTRLIWTSPSLPLTGIRSIGH